MLSCAASEYSLGFGELTLAQWNHFVFRLRIHSFSMEEVIPSVRQQHPSTGVGQLPWATPHCFPLLSVFSFFFFFLRLFVFLAY